MSSQKRDSMDNLFKEEKRIRRKLLDMRFDQACGKLVDLTAPRRNRKLLARILTKINMGNLNFTK